LKRIFGLETIRCYFAGAGAIRPSSHFETRWRGGSLSDNRIIDGLTKSLFKLWVPRLRHACRRPRPQALGNSI